MVALGLSCLRVWLHFLSLHLKLTWRNKFLDNTSVSLASKTNMVYASNINKTDATLGVVLKGMKIIQDNNLNIN